MMNLPNIGQSLSRFFGATLATGPGNHSPAPEPNQPGPFRNITSKGLDLITSPVGLTLTGTALTAATAATMYSVNQQWDGIDTILMPLAVGGVALSSVLLGGAVHLGKNPPRGDSGAHMACIIMGLSSGGLIGVGSLVPFGIHLFMNL